MIHKRASLYFASLDSMWSKQRWADIQFSTPDPYPKKFCISNPYPKISEI